MKSKKLGLLILLLFLAVGFAAVTTNLILNGNTKIGMGDFDVFFSQAYPDDSDDHIEISEDKHSLTFNTRVLSMASVDEHDSSIFHYQIANNSADYDADVELRINIESTIDYAEYIESVLLYEEDGTEVEITDGTTVTIPAKSFKDGIIQIYLLKPVTEDAVITFGVDLFALPTTRLASAAPGMTDVMSYQTLAAGLYDTNMNLIKTWDELKQEETIYVSDEGELYSNYTGSNGYNMNVTGGYGGTSGSPKASLIDMNNVVGKLNSILSVGHIGGIGETDIYSYFNSHNTSCPNLNGVLVVDEEVNSTRAYNFTCPSLKAVVFKKIDSDTVDNNQLGFAGIKVFNGIPENGHVYGYNTGNYFSAGNAVIKGEWAYDVNDPTRIVAYLGNNTNIVIPDGITEIYGPAFSYIEIEDITFPESLNKLGDGAFANILNDSITIPGTVNEIGSYIINNSKVTDVTLIDGIKRIGSYAFYYSGLNEIYVPNSVTSIGEEAFGAIKSLYYTGSAPNDNDNWGAKFLNPYINGDFVYADEELSILQGYEGRDKNVVVPDGVVSIIKDAFSYKALESITLPNTLLEIHDSPFENYNYDVLEIPSSVVSIDNNAFDGVFLIKYHGSATFDDDNRNWGATYLNHYKIDGMIISEDGKNLVKYYSPYFDSNSTTIELTIPDGVENISAYAFKNELHIRKVFIPNSVKSIGENTFEYTHIDEITVPSTVESIGNDAFDHVMNILYDGSLTGDSGYNDEIFGAYHKNAYLENTFIYEDSTKKKVIDSTYRNKKVGNIDMVIPEGVEEIGDSAFASISKITSLSLPTSLRTIGPSAFHYCGINSRIIIPNGVESIGRGAFASNTPNYIYIPSSVRSIGVSAFIKYSFTTGLTGDVVFEEHGKWCINPSDSNLRYHEGDYFNDTQAVFNELVLQGNNSTWERVD